MSDHAKLSFVRQMGFEKADTLGLSDHYSGLMFQPWLVGIIVAVSLLLQSGPLFLALGALLWWNALFPALNPFDAVYDRLIAIPKGRTRLGPAPPPRRFSQAFGGTFMLVIGACLVIGWHLAAWILQGVVVAALAALFLGHFCLGAYLFHLLRGNSDYARQTLPWSRG